MSADTYIFFLFLSMKNDNLINQDVCANMSICVPPVVAEAMQVGPQNYSILFAMIKYCDDDVYQA